MQRRAGARSAALVILATGASLVAAAPAAGQDSKAILVLHTYGQDAPARMPFDVAFSRTIRESAANVDLYIETLDPSHFRGEGHAQRTRQYLREKYADKTLAAVVAVYGLALDFLIDERGPLFPGVPLAATLTRYPEAMPPGVAVIWSGNAIGRTIAQAVQLHPRTRQIALIDGSLTRFPADAPNSLFHIERRQIESVAPHLPIIDLRHVALDELLPRVQALPPDTIILFLRQFIGRSGAPINNAESLAEVARVAPAPVYVVTDPLVGSGAVGGVVISIDREATQLATLALRVAETGASDLPPVESELVPMFDWRQLTRWGIDQRLLPANSVVAFHQPSVWEEYRSVHHRDRGGSDPADGSDCWIDRSARTAPADRTRVARKRAPLPDDGRYGPCLDLAIRRRRHL